MFAPLAWALAAHGFTPVRFGYPGRRLSAAQAVERLRAFLEALPRRDEPVHFVGFSLGALMIRGALVPPPHHAVGRVVMIGPPNRGVGHLGDRRAHWTPYLFGPAVNDLHVGSAFLAALPEPNVPIGVIAGTRRFSPINPSSWLRLASGDRTPGDGTVELHNTRLDRPHDFIALPVNHTLMARNRAVIRATIRFLEHGAFAPNAKP
jgi:triacylglycerol lipase